MKTLSDIRSPNIETSISEGVLKTGAAAVAARNAKSHGDVAQSRFVSAKQKLSHTPKTSEEKMNQLGAAIVDVADGLISLRKQLGAITTIGLINSVQVQQITKNNKRRGRR
jgi:hypothetical protein